MPHHGDPGSPRRGGLDGYQTDSAENVFKFGVEAVVKGRMKAVTKAAVDVLALPLSLP